MQESLEKLLSNLFKEDIALQSSGRTDAGVHAFSQMAHFCLPKITSINSDFKNLKKTDDLKILIHRLECLLKAVKKLCPANIQIKEAFLVDDNFHALRSAVNKTYTYFISNETSPFNSSQIYNVSCEVFDNLKNNINLLNQMSSYLVGAKDFKAFQNTGTDVKTTVREIYQSSWKLHKLKKSKLEPISLLGAPQEYLEFNITGNGFLKQMVRNIVGCQMYLAQKTSEPLIGFKDIIRLAKTQKIFAPAPPQGLYLKQINYPASLDKLALKI